MADIRVQNLSKTFHVKPPLQALDNVSFEVRDGEVLVLLGPSGCGKTTMLRCLAGLESPDVGAIHFGDTVAFDSTRRINVKPHRRGIGLVFQSFALWPHMNAYSNIEFPLRARGTPSADREAMVRTTAGTVGLDERHLAKRPGQLSGGQQQRVALARALVGEAGLLLFDEPLSNLDARLREEIREELHALHSKLGFTSVFVTHDLTEALALGDRIAVMDKGKIVQMGAPSAVFEHPGNLIVANLVGMRRFANLARADGAWRGTVGVATLGQFLPEGVGEVSVFAWPDRMDVFGEPTAASANHLCVPATVSDVSYMGSNVVVSLTTEAGKLRVVRGRHEANLYRLGDRVAVGVLRDDLRCFDASGTAIELRKDASVVQASATVFSSRHMDAVQ